jgi:CheY-like chemotaxis protein
MKNATILLVDDDQVDALALTRAFRAKNIRNPIVRAKDGIEALELLRGEGRPAIPAPYIILLDLNMPRMSGIEFLEELRTDAVLGGTVVFVLTTSGTEEDRKAAYRNHVAGYVQKSAAGEDFVDMVALLEQFWKIVELPGSANWAQQRET